MKKIIVCSLLFVCIKTTAQKIASEDTTAKPIITAVGKLDGTKSTIKINKGGSSLQSSDGIIELIIPDGAVPKNTTISIQPITNLMANGNGKAYRLEPSGIQFKKPLQLIFHYDEEEIKDSMQLLGGMAMQDNKGQWLGLKYCAIDTLANTITGNISHFSDWANFMKIKLYPSTARLKVKKQITLTIDLISSEDEELTDLTPAGTDDLAPLKKSKIPFTTTWKANEITNGNTKVGTIDKGSETVASYKAPAVLPDKNPVHIRADLKGLRYTTKVFGNTITYTELFLESNILVYDEAYEVKIISSLDGSAGSEMGAVNYMDTGSCVISIDGKNSKIIEKVNKNTAASWGYAGKCITTKLKSGSGNVHIIGAQSIKVIPPILPGVNAWIAVEFIRAPTILPLLQFKCPPVGGQGGWYTSTSAMTNAFAAKMIQALPHRVKFEAKEGEQVIVDEKGDGSVLKITVEKLTED